MKVRDFIREFEEEWGKSRHEWTRHQFLRALIRLAGLTISDKLERGRPRNLFRPGALIPKRSPGRPRAKPEDHARLDAMDRLDRLDVLKAKYAKQGIKKTHLQLWVEVNRDIASELGLPTQSIKRRAEADAKRESEWRKLLGRPLNRKVTRTRKR